jgi:hypothetical protein
VNTQRSGEVRTGYLSGQARGWRLALVTWVAMLGASPQAWAGLINSSYNLRLTGPVAEGASTSFEVYSANNLMWDAATHKNLTNLISPTPSPNPFASAANRINRVVEPTGGHGTSGIATIWIKGPLTDPNNVFVNDLDLTKLVELEISSLEWDNLPAGQQIVVNNLRLDKGVFYDPVSVSYTGTGSVANPLNILARFDPADVNRLGGNYVKVQFSFGTQAIVIPEPATVALGVLAFLAAGQLIRRRSR